MQTTGTKEMRDDAAARPLVLVTGATGAQGGSVARHLLRRGRFAVRALTRNPDSPAARALRELGAEVVRGDLADVESLRAAMAGAYGVFGVTNFWEHFAGEYQHGINIVDAVSDSGIGHFVFSTLPSVSELTEGALPVPHFDLKAKMEAYARSLSLPATFVHLAFYYENFLGFTPMRRQADGSYRFGFPQGDTPLAGVSVEDVGGVIAQIFERRGEFLGKNIYIVGDDIPAAEYAAIMSDVAGRTIAYEYVPRDAFAAQGFPGAEDLANMFEFYRTRVPSRQADLARSRELYPEIQDFRHWMARHRAGLEAVLAG
ncbi:MAG TPA: NmrA/HSCARG family protein [Gemmatimonadaceae bacterium]|nr:NmrA/HSCARG family protein [Gemmatimonadaceae bacterium]